MTSLHRKPEINDLSLLSLLAAHELERIERREPSDGQYLSALRNHLLHQVDPAREDMKNIAPSTVQLYRRAVRDATNIDPPDFSALVKQLDHLLRQLGIASESASNGGGRKKAIGNLKPLLAFVISLHGQLLAQKQRLPVSAQSLESHHLDDTDSSLKPLR
jgi:hypothetical protein